MLEDLHQRRAFARRAMDQGRLEEAEAALLEGALETHVAEEDYVTVLEPLADLRARRGDARGALTIRLYLARGATGGWDDCGRLLPDVPMSDRGHALAAMGRPTLAAAEMEHAGRVATAAVYRERGGDFAGARTLWARLAQAMAHEPPVAGGDGEGGALYMAALVQCNLARCASRCGDARQARDASVAAVRLLEEAADRLESVGLRERAFDCFQALIQLGREHHAFEDAVEGFVNCIRILREDHLAAFALQFLDEAITLARESDELSAAATLALEASQYARRAGDGDAAVRYARLQGELWLGAARLHVARGDSPDVAENALLAGVTAFGEAGQFAQVGVLYDELAKLPVPAARSAHYARARARYAGVGDDGAKPSRRTVPREADAAVSDVWHVDLLEWDERGSAVECCTNLLLDASQPAVTRRKALVCRLTALDVEGKVDDGSPEHVGTLVRLADQLAQLQAYVVLAPLEALFRSRYVPVRVAVVSALQRLFFKRTFVTLRTALADPHDAVALHAATALEALHFPEAFDPLARIARDAESPRARAGALRAIARMNDAAAAEFLLGVLETGAPSDRAAAEAALRASTSLAFLAAARAASPTASRGLRPLLDDLLAGR